MAEQIYNWKRFWCPRGGSINLSHGGYLSDPDSEWGRISNPNVVPLDSIAQIPCLILLGEPGIGKSRALKAEREAINLKVKQEGNEAFWFDLRSCGSEERLVHNLFESDEFIAKTKGSHRLYIFLDSLDEGLLRISVLAPLLVNELKKIEKQTLQRLFLHIACRTADWPQSLEIGLQELWGEDVVRAYELAPLRREDVIEAARANNLDSDEFLAEIDRVEAVPLAIKPITLDFLLRQYQKNRHFPKTRVALYREGCLLLCEETNQNRRDTQLRGDFSAEQRLIVASRIAAVTIFANRYAVWNDVDRGDVPDEDVAVRELVGGQEKADGNEFEVSERVVKETLGTTGLFSARGLNRLGWAHQTYAEFLAAYYLVHSGISLSQLMSLIVHPSDQEGKLVPQLHETAAWLAARVPEILQRIMKTDPEVLLRSDVTTTSESERAKLVEALLEGCEREQSLLFQDWNAYRHFGKLAHPNLAEQLRPYIGDSMRNSLARNVAIELVEACKLQSLEADLVRIALDPTQLLRIRQDAASAVARIGTTEGKAKLKLLATGEIGDDPNDELKAHGLRAAWPKHMTVEELLTCLTLPKRSDFIGAYQMFVQYELPQTIKSADLLKVMNWVGRQPRYDKFRLIEQFADAIMLQAWEHLDDPEILEAFARVALLRLEKHEEIFRDRSGPRSGKVLQSNEAKRRQILETILNILSETGKDLDTLFYSNSHLVSSTDIPWLIRRLQATASEKMSQAWAQTIEKCFNRSGLSQVDVILTACQNNPTLAKVLAWLLKPVELDSPEAQTTKAQYLEMQRWQDQLTQRPLLDPPPAQRISTLLDACEAGDLDAWWRLNMEMTLRPNGTHPHSEFESDLTVLPGWEDADTATRGRIIEAAKKYVVQQRPEIHKWLEANTFHCPTFAGYKALRLLLQEEPEWLSSLSHDVWSKWAPIILAYPLSSGTEKKKAHRELLKRAYDHAPTQIIETLMVLIDKENKEHGDVYITHEVEGCWDERLASVLLAKAQDEELQSKALGHLLCVLLDHNAEAVRTFAATLISSRASSAEEQWSKASITACALLTHANDAGWSIVWPVLQADREFGKEVITTAVYDFRTKPIQLNQLKEDQLADFYIWLSQQFPHAEDSQLQGESTPSAREMIGRFRDSVLRHLKDRGTFAACEAIRKIAGELPQLDWLKWTLLEAQHITRQRTWAPPKPKDILELAKNQQGRLVQSGEQLLEVLLESLERLEQRLRGENSQAESLWNQVRKTKWKPKDENWFSSYMEDHLRGELTPKGVVVNREVVIRRSTGNRPGERVDIQVDAISKKPSGEEYDRISVVIEVKGCWHKELNQAMKTQLIDRYLNEARCKHGLYLIGWFNCPQWSTSDSRQKKAPKQNLEEARKQFDSQARELSQSGVTVKAFVMNTALR